MVPLLFLRWKFLPWANPFHESNSVASESRILSGGAQCHSKPWSYQLFASFAIWLLERTRKLSMPVALLAGLGHGLFVVCRVGRFTVIEEEGRSTWQC